ncbi:MAG: metallophosphoesterase family protein [Candidatus Hydrogenedentales bacterium]
MSHSRIISWSICMVLALMGMAMANAESPVLRFKEDGTFRIVQFADVHWTVGNAEDKESLQLMRDVLDAETPDLVVYTGDNTTGGAILPSRGLRQVTEASVERNLPWAAVFGNHDDEGPASRAKLMELMQTLPGCLAQAGPKDIDGVSNYILSVASSKDAAKPAALLYYIDSLSYMTYQGESKYNHIQPAQVEWYRNESTRLREANGGTALPALAFFHIPLPEYNQVWESGKSIGVKQEDVCNSPVNSGLFDVMVEMGDVMGVFCGHDHTNDYIGELEGIYLAYGRGSGYGTYGKEGFSRGARVIELVEGERAFKTWLRLRTGEKVEQLPKQD